MKKIFLSILTAGAIFGAAVPAFARNVDVSVYCYSPYTTATARAYTYSQEPIYYLKAKISGFVGESLMDSAEKTAYFANSVTTPSITLPDNFYRNFVGEVFAKTSSIADMEYYGEQTSTYY
ncbi:hypothetical protein AN641_05090 [Candidatus Epulonipiscioides gigas]|nr:hypothetical protein AN641_05090 [Epulopiscium sp. SCG-C07WGA-EpuloA2]